jgi:hypothetical protein
LPLEKNIAELKKEALQMTNRSCNGRPKGRTIPPESSATFPEPEVRRWPHPVGAAEPAISSDAALHYIRCALSYQNQLLADIKSHLEKIATTSPSDSAEK